MSCHRHQLPGLSIHLAHYVYFVFDPYDVRPVTLDPVGRLFDIRRMDNALKERVAAALSLVFSWSRVGALSRGVYMKAYHHPMLHSTPLQSFVASLLTGVPSRMSQAVMSCDTSEVDLWLQKKNDAATLHKVGIPACHLQGNNVSSTSRTLAINHKAFSTINLVSANGQLFPTSGCAFEAELVSQAAELHNSRRGHEPDHLHLLAGVCGDSIALHDDRNFSSQMELFRLKVVASEAFQSPSFAELHQVIHSSAFEATSLDELPASVVRLFDSLVSASGAIYFVLCSTGSFCWW